MSPNGLVANIVSFNVGVEIGQVLALSMVLIALGYWRGTSAFLRHAYLTNAVLMAAGFVFMGYQLPATRSVHNQVHILRRPSSSTFPRPRRS